MEEINAWVITRHADAIAALRDRRLSRSDPAEKITYERIPLLTAFQETALAYADYENHARMRHILHKSFSEAITAELQNSARAIVDDLLDTLTGRTEIDFINDYADPLPASFIAKLIGLPASYWPDVRHWSHTIKKGLLPGAKAAAQIECNTALQAYSEAVLATSAERRQQPQNDLLSTLIALEQEGQQLSEAELLSNCLLMLIAGHEAVTSLLANGLHALLQHPDQLTKLMDNATLLPTAVEEMARYGRPTQMIPRFVSEDLELNGNALKQGQNVVVFLGAANFDPEVFAEPKRFDIARQPNPHLGYGYGMHYCFGAPLARIASPIAFQEFLERYPQVQLAPKAPEYLDLRQDTVLEQLWVKLTPTASETTTESAALSAYDFAGLLSALTA